MRPAPYITRSKLILAALVIVVVGVMFVAWLPVRQPQVFGNISSQDVSVVTGVVRVAMKEPLLPDLSWDSIRSLPAGIRQRWSERIISIRAGSNETVKVTTGVEQGLMSMSQYNLKKTADGWVIVGIVSSGEFVAAPGNSL